MLVSKYGYINNFLSSGKQFSKDDFYLHFNYQAANLVLFIHTLTFVSLLCFHFFMNDFRYAFINSLAAFFSISTIIILRILDKKYFYL